MGRVRVFSNDVSQKMLQLQRGFIAMSIVVLSLATNVPQTTAQLFSTWDNDDYYNSNSFINVYYYDDDDYGYVYVFNSRRSRTYKIVAGVGGAIFFFRCFSFACYYFLCAAAMAGGNRRAVPVARVPVVGAAAAAVSTPVAATAFSAAADAPPPY